MPVLTEHDFAALLERLAPDRGQAGEKYEELRRTLIRFFEWRNAPFPEEHADETLTRLAARLGDGLEVRNIGGYSYEIARLVFLESLKGKDSKRIPLDEFESKSLAINVDDSRLEREVNLNCLDSCLNSLPEDARSLIMEYYRDENSGHADHRRGIATRLGMSREALANRAQRLRDKLEVCVRKCAGRKSSI